MTRGTTLALVALAAGGLAAGGCAATKWAVGMGKEYRMYPGAPRPLSEIAVVECDSASGVSVTEIDGMRKRIQCGLAELGSMKIEVLPGPHTVKLRLFFSQTTRTFYSDAELAKAFEARAGATYRLGCAVDSAQKRWRPTIVLARNTRP